MAALLLAWLFYLYALGWHSFGSHSDSANGVLAGRDLVGGNMLLEHWNLPAASYWPVELALYGLFSAVSGLDPAAVHVVPTVVGAAVVLLGAWLARTGRRGLSGWVAGGAVLVLLGLPHPFLTYILFQGPWHVGTAFWCLAAFSLLRHGLGTLRWWLGVAVLGAAITGDALALATGAAPVLVAGLLGTLRGRDWRPLRAAGAGSGLAIAGAVLTRLALDHLGGFSVAQQSLAPRGTWEENLRLIPRLMTTLLGWGDGTLTGSYRALHLFGLVAVATGVAATLVGVLRRTLRRGAVGRGPGGAPRDWPSEDRANWLDDVLLAGFFGGLVAAVVIMAPGPALAGARYLPAPLVYGVILAGRRLGQVVPHLHPRATRPLALAGLALAAAYLVASASFLSYPPNTHKERELAAWLESQDLRAGFGSYWAASDVVLNSGGRVTVRPVVAVKGKLHGLWFYAPRRWFEPVEPSESTPRFVVYDLDLPWGGVDAGVAAATFGPPARTLRFRSYDVLVWEQNLGPLLGRPPWRPGDPL